MSPVALLASYKNIPAFGWITSDPILEDKSVYTTLVRLLWPIANIGKVCTAITALPPPSCYLPPPSVMSPSLYGNHVTM